MKSHRKSKSIIKMLSFIAAYIVICYLAIILLIRNTGTITGWILTSENIISEALAQLSNARIEVPVWILLCGAVIPCALRVIFKKRRKIVSVTASVTAAITSIAGFAAALINTKINGVLIYIVIGIIKKLLESGIL